MDTGKTVHVTSFFVAFAGFTGFVLVQGTKWDIKHRTSQLSWREAYWEKKPALKSQREKHKINLNLTKMNKIL